MYKKLYRSRTKRSISGVCGGLEDYFNLDVTIIRLVWVLITIATGFAPGIFAYVAAAMIIPEETGANTNVPNNSQPFNNPFGSAPVDPTPADNAPANEGPSYTLDQNGDKNNEQQ